MAEQSKGSPEPKTEAEKKQAETVQLTAEELRTIAGGAGVTNPPNSGTQATPSNSPIKRI
jgi:hypothetical protein